MNKAIYVVSALLLAACGGSSTSVDQVARLAEIEVEVMRLTTTFEDLDDRNVEARIPTVGSATYEGYATIVVGLGDFDTSRVQSLAAGDFTASVDFAAETMTGEATNFINVSNAQAIADDEDVDPIFGSQVSGTITMAGPVNDIFPDIAISGTLTDPDFTSVTVDSEFADARLLGLNHEIFQTDTEANVTLGNGEDGWFEFEAIGERQ